MGNNKMFIAQGPFALPHKKIQALTLNIVENALKEAWSRLKSRSFKFTHEDKITEALYKTVVDELFNKGIVPGFGKETFGSLRRDAKIDAYDGTSDQMPDFVVDFVDKPYQAMNTQHGLFIECKPIKKRRSLGTYYCGKGIFRYVSGNYAWAMRNGLMVGYVDAKYMSQDLGKTFKKPKQKRLNIAKGPAPCRLSKSSVHSNVTLISVHLRNFKYQHNLGAPGPIEIRHLWMQTN